MVYLHTPKDIKNKMEMELTRVRVVHIEIIHVIARDERAYLSSAPLLPRASNFFY